MLMEENPLGQFFAKSSAPRSRSRSWAGPIKGPNRREDQAEEVKSQAEKKKMGRVTARSERNV